MSTKLNYETVGFDVEGLRIINKFKIYFNTLFVLLSQEVGWGDKFFITHTFGTMGRFRDILMSSVKSVIAYIYI